MENIKNGHVVDKNDDKPLRYPISRQTQMVIYLSWGGWETPWNKSESCLDFSGTRNPKL